MYPCNYIQSACQAPLLTLSRHPKKTGFPVFSTATLILSLLSSLHVDFVRGIHDVTMATSPHISADTGDSRSILLALYFKLTKVGAVVAYGDDTGNRH